MESSDLINITKVPEGEEREKGQKKLLKNTGWKVSKFDPEHQPTDSVSSAAPMQDKYKKRHLGTSQSHC